MLKYLFTATFADGSVIEQPEDDRSTLNPEKRSTFYDVVQNDKELVRFDLKGEGRTFSVSLIDGHFEVDGVPFQMHEEELSGFKLIFFRNHTHHFSATHQEISHDIVYRMGWQCTVDGENHQRVMQID